VPLALKGADVELEAMPKVCRILAIALLAVALPLQGLAGVVSAQCMVIGHHADAGLAGHTHVDGSEADSHDHGHSHGEENAAEHTDGTKPSHCGPCTACCASASIASAAARVISPSLSPTLYVFSQLAPPAVEPDGVDRPPLSLS
jgi:hypothetical protein